MSETVGAPPIANRATAPVSLRRAFLAGAAWSMIGYAAAQALRLVTTLLLARMLVPEHFGLMALINVFMIGLNMFSDIGIGPSIVQSARGEARTFLDTAWTLQAVRGCILWLVCMLLAWPFADFYGDPRLVWLLPAAGFAAVIGGLNSTKIFSAYRDLKLGRLTMIELVAQMSAAAFMLTVAWLYPSIWVLVAGSLVAAAVKALLSHICLEGSNNRFCWSASEVAELVDFGRWVFLSTLLSFASASAASLILGKVLTMSELGIFTLMSTLAKVVEQAYEQISSKVVMPTFAKIKHQPIEQIRASMFKLRLRVFALFVPPLWLLTVFGQRLVELLFDARYHSGGWMLQAFSASAIPGLITAVNQYYLARGDSKLSMQMAFGRLVFYLSSILVGWFVGGATGMIWGMALHSILVYGMDLWVQFRHSILLPRFDAAAIGLSAGVIATGLAMTGQL